MAIPSECRMPDLSGLDSPLLNRLLVQLLVGERGLSPKVKLYRRNFIRLIDKALREYHNAREAILGEIQGIRQTFGIAFTDHIETCVNAVRRLYNLLDRIKSDKESPLLPRDLRRLVETQSESIKDIRDAVEHIDERIQKDERAPGTPIMLVVSENEDGVVVDNYEIKFKDLAVVLEKMNEIAKYILTIKRVETQHST